MIDWKRKLTSRKFWMAIAGFVSMLIAFFGGSDELAAQITSLILAGATVVAYIIAEGLVDANATGIEDAYLYDDEFVDDEENDEEIDNGVDYLD
jgi:hypothetical protein